MKVNPISFKGVYHCQMNAREDFGKFAKVALLRNTEDNSGVRIVFEHQNYDSIVSSIQGFQEADKSIPSIEWLINHARNVNIKLPKYLTKCDFDIYLLTDKDKKDYERKLLKRENILTVSNTVNKISGQIEKNSPGPTHADNFLRLIKDFDETEQKEFDKFLKGRQVTPMSIEEDEDGNIHIMGYEED